MRVNIRQFLAVTMQGLLIAGAVALADHRNADAAFSTDVLLAYGECITVSELQQEDCNEGCCFLGLCGKRCLSRCAAEDLARQEQCSATILGISSDGAFFDTATIARNGRKITVGGPLQCPEGATADLQVTLTQSGNGALAVGHVRVPCDPDQQAFTVDLHTIGRAQFHALDQAQACGTARIVARGVSLDAFQWCRDLTIVPDGIQLQED